MHLICADGSLGIPHLLASKPASGTVTSFGNVIWITPSFGTEFATYALKVRPVFVNVVSELALREALKNSTDLVLKNKKPASLN